MKSKNIISLILILSLGACSSTSNSAGPSYGANALIGTAAGAGVGAAIGSAISNGDVAGSAMLGAGVGLVVGVAGTYAYEKIQVHNEIIDNDNSIEANRLQILSAQTELDKRRAEAMADSNNFDFEKSRTEKLYDGATKGVYFR